MTTTFSGPSSEVFSDQSADRSLPAVEPRIALPTTNDDGTRTAFVAGPLRRFGDSTLLPLHLPAGLAQAGVSGRYVLARCGPQSGAATVAERAESWEIYLRRPLYAAMHHVVMKPAEMARWELLLPRTDDPGYRWLAAQPVGAPVNLLGPFGQGYRLLPQSRNLLLLTDGTFLPLVLGLCDAMLDRGGRVTIVLRLQSGAVGTALQDQLPIPVELRIAASDPQWQEQLGETIRWADQIAVALPQHDLPDLGQAIAQHRFRFEPDFAHALVQADLLCGIGACLACVVPMREGGYTRACVHGPVFDLKTLV
jgi:dihydroorotate dehydrogenase electron transfer subunit